MNVELPPNRLAVFALLLAAACLLGACTISFHTTVTDSGSGSLDYEFGLDQADVTTLSGLGQTPDQFCDNLNSQGGLPANATIRKEQRSDSYFCIISLPFASLADLRQAYANNKGITVNQLDLTNGHFTYDVTVDGASATSAAAGQLGSAQPVISWQVTAPGDIGANNADKIEGNTLMWAVSTSGSKHLHAESTRSRLALPGGNLAAVIAVLVACFGCLIVLAVAAAGLFWFTRRRKPKPAVVVGGSQPPS